MLESMNKKELEQEKETQDLQETQQEEVDNEKYEREQFVRSPFFFIGLLICAIASVCILSKGQTGKELLFHIAYIAGFLVYTLFFFISKKFIPKMFTIKAKGKRVMYDLADCVFTVFVAFILATFFLDCFKISVVDGDSMTNTLQDGQKLILSTHIYDFQEIECNAEELQEYIVKRVIGRPGDHLVIKDNQVYINDELLEEEYIRQPMITEDLDITIPEGKLFVMGDNRNDSGDSRWDAIGLIDIEEDLQGKIILQSLFGIKEYN